MAKVLVTRPADLGRETTERLQRAGHEAILLPLLEPRAIAWTPPEGDFDAVLFTSPQAPVLAGSGLERYRTLPAWAIGERTADAARAAGFHHVRIGRGHGRRLHLAGRDLAPSEPDPQVTIVPVYAAELADAELARATLRQLSIDWALLFSARAASHFATLVDSPGDVSIAAISERAMIAAGPGWRRAVAAAQPDESGILAAAGLLCENDTL